MKLGTVNLLRGLLLLAAAAVSMPSHADWASSSVAYVVRAQPTNAQVQPQNPPSFTWAMYSTKPAQYKVELTLSGGLPQTFTVDRNWWLPTSTLPAGTYSWRVTPATVTDWSSPRTFVIDSSSKPFVVPDNATLKARILGRAHPRGLSRSLYPMSAWPAGMTTDRSALVTSLSGGVIRRITAVPVYTDASWPLDTTGTLTAAGNTQISQIRWAMLDVTRQIEASALLWRLTGNTTYLNEAITRGNQLAALSPYGPTSYAADDQDDRLIALGLMKAVDLLGADLPAANRSAWLANVEARITVIYNAFRTPDGGFDEFPFDSHGALAQGYLALISTLALGDIPAASDWFDFSFRAYCNSIYPWSGTEGGFANGTSYGQHMALASLTVWQPIAAATDINLFAKPWSLGFMRMFMHFQPPGSVRHTFGDEHENAPMASELKGYASRFATPEAAWYARSLTVAEDALTVLQAPWPLPVASVTTATPPPNSGYYPSTGWVAMHSNITDVNRTSLYFKSSAYGSYNHSHADQNGIVLNSGTRPLLIESGWYDWYGSPMWESWYRQTKAHNGITIDGGIGQALDGYQVQLTRIGKVTSFASTASMDYAEGDATLAYDSKLSLAKRQLWYLRTLDAVVVLDKLAAPAAHVFEWNMHAAATITADANNVASFTNIDRSLCVRPVTKGLTFVKRVGPAPKAGTFEDHAAYLTPSATTGEFLMVLDVGCKNPSITLTTTSSGRTLKVGTVSITLPK
jgi:hypothetical protein